MARLEGKIALITGGARGQGAAEAARFAAEGATVVITDVLDDVGAATAQQLAQQFDGAVTYRHHDVADEQQWQSVVDQVVAEHGRVDVLVNNAGIFRIRSLFDTTTDDWDSMVAINQTGVFLGLRTVGRVMRDQGSGSIINISSIAGLQGAGIALAYGATKWAVRGMTKSAARELGPFNVRVNSVHPGIIDTPMADEFGDLLPVVKAQIPLGRLGTAEDVAEVVVFLASDESSFCSGHEFVVDGAQTA